MRNPSPTPIWLVVPVVLGLAGCGSGKSGSGPGGDDPLPAGCDDPDGDGFGRGADCAAPDCDESDAARHDGCPQLCSNCQESCFGAEGGCVAFDPNAGDGLESAEDGGLTVTGDQEGGGPALSLIWIANSAQGTVSKVDTRTHQELGRYYTGVNHLGDSPSRTSVDYHGDVVVANRAFGIQASVTRILAGPCPDRDGDGIVRTSTGRDDVLPFDGGLPTDECIAWRTEVGCSGGQGDREDGSEEGGLGGGFGCGVARAITVQDRAGLDGVDAEVVWVGLFEEQKYVELDRRTGVATGVEVSVAPCTPYGAAIDRDGHLWSACLSSNLASFDTANPGAGARVIQQPGSNYGITVDEHGHVWTGGSVTRYDPATGTFLQPGVDGEAEPCEGQVPGENGADGRDCGWMGQAYGSAIAADGQGSVWVGGCGGGVCRVREEGDTLTLTSLAVSNGAYGMAVDFDGKVWGIGMGGNNAAVIDPDTETFELVLNDCEGGGGGDPDGNQEGWEGGFGTGCLVNPYTYSDMTGFQLRNAQDPRGSLPLRLEGCADGPTSWRTLVADADVPAGSSISIEARAADTEEALAALPFSAVGSLVDGETLLDLSALSGRVLELRITLRGGRGARPVLHDVHTAWSCEELFG